MSMVQALRLINWSDEIPEISNVAFVNSTTQDTLKSILQAYYVYCIYMYSYILPVIT